MLMGVTLDSTGQHPLFTAKILKLIGFFPITSLVRGPLTLVRKNEVGITAAAAGIGSAVKDMYFPIQNN